MCRCITTRVSSYLYGCHFTLITEHKPLLTLINESEAVRLQASGRIQHWALTLAAYEYTLLWCPAKQHENADAISHLPLPEKPLETPLPAECVLLMEHLEESLVTARSEVMLGELHARHPGISRTKTLVRMFVWWPVMDGDLPST